LLSCSSFAPRAMFAEDSKTLKLLPQHGATQQVAKP
jgi:hypothetical protein